MVYQEWLTEWLFAYMKPSVKRRTFEKYQKIVDTKIVPKLGEYSLDELSASILQGFTAEISEQYSANTVSGIIAVIKSSLRRAQKTGIVERQFSDFIQLPKNHEKKIESFTLKEQKKIEQFILSKNKPKLYGILLCFYTGLRIGELLALEWTDIDFRKGTLSVTKSCRDIWENGKYRKEIDTPKTEASNRVIPLPKQVIPYLREIRTERKSEYILYGKGNDLSLRSYQKTFELMLKKLEIPHRGFHAIRHTFATRALECGMDVKTLSEILGHNNPALTLKRYAHSMLDHKSAMMNKLGKLLK